MRLQVLGCSGGIGATARTTALLVDDDVLIDAGTGVFDLDIDVLSGIRHIFVTHSHLDHVLSIPLLMDSLFDRLATPLTVHAMPETIEAMSTHLFNWTIWPDFRQLPEPDQALLHFAPMRPGDVRTIGGRSMEMIEVRHSVPAAGFLVSGDSGGCFCFSGDTGPNENLWSVLNQRSRLDLLLVETAFSNDHQEIARAAGHYVPATLVDDLQRLHHDPRIAITHLKTGSEDRIMGELQALAPEREFHRLQAGDVFTL